MRESTHRHQEVCFWPDVSTFIPRSSSKDRRGDLRSDSYVLASCSACVYECVKWCRCGCPNASQTFENSDKTTEKREGGGGGVGVGGGVRERELNRESQWWRCECANEREQLNAVRVAKVAEIDPHLELLY